MAKKIGTMILYLCTILFAPVLTEGISDVNYMSVLETLGLGEHYLHKPQQQHYATDMLSKNVETNVYSMPLNGTLLGDSRNFNVSEKCLLHTESCSLRYASASNRNVHGMLRG